MAIRVKVQGIKAKKSYSVDELAYAADVSPQTVRSWLKAGMQRMDGGRPTLIMGFQALDYLAARKRDAKQPMALGQFFCLRCKTPKAALGGMADYVATSPKGGRLKALCADCECQCNLNISATDLPALRKILDVEIRPTT